MIRKQKIPFLIFSFYSIYNLYLIQTNFPFRFCQQKFFFFFLESVGTRVQIWCYFRLLVGCLLNAIRAKTQFRSWTLMEVNSSVPPETDNASGGLHHLTSTSIPRRSPHQSPIRPGLVPTYFPVNTIIEKKEDNPGPRCGHTLTAVAAVGEEGSPGYIGPRLILFGGATALENNATTSGALSSPGSSSISTFFFPRIWQNLYSCINAQSQQFMNRKHACVEP